MNSLKDYSAKIRDIYIELKGYTFFHRPSGVDTQDRRFIGREKSINKLKTILSHTETKSGAYLITGFRGMGKTSVVNKAISELKGMNQVSPEWYRYIRIFLAILFFSFFDVTGLLFDIISLPDNFNISGWIFDLFLLVIFPMLLFVYCLNDISVRKYKKTIFELQLVAFFKQLHFKKVPNYTSNYLNILVKDFIFASCIHLLTTFTLLVYFLQTPENTYPFPYSSKFRAYVLLYILVLFIYKNIEYIKRKLLREKSRKYFFTLSKIFLGLFILLFLFNIVISKILFLISSFPYYSSDYLSRPIKFFIDQHDKIISTIIGISLLTISFFLKKGLIKKSILYFSFLVILYQFISTCIIIEIIIYGITVLFLIYLIYQIISNKRSYIDSWASKLFNFSHIIEVKINLGQENLNEKDILRLIAKTIYTKYKAINSPFFSSRRFAWFVASTFVIYITSLTLFHYRPTYAILNELRDNDALVSQYFPSQAYFQDNAVTYRKEQDILSEIERKEEEKKKFNVFQYTEIVSNNIVIIDKFNITLLQKILIRVDYFVYVVYNEISEFLFEAIPNLILDKEDNREINLLNRSLDLHENFHVLPPRIDYFFWIFFFIFFQFIRLLSYFKLTGVGHRNVLLKLRRLIDGIDASVTQEANTSIGKGKRLFFERKSQKAYPILGERDIENELINILNLCDKIAPIRLRPRFVFIFDELDKIEPTGKYARKEEIPTGTYTTEGTRKREEAIGRMLSNLKHFFNTAKAKFIFIAGREMYDASLADISDRDSLIGSIFHDVIYIPSFYKDPFDKKLSDISSMTEHYVCQFLIPDNYNAKNNQSYTLKDYYNFLCAKKEELSLDINEVARTIIILQQFITYLTYRSNGSPKKITKLFEEYVFKHDFESRDIDSILYVGQEQQSLYLQFNYYDQYIFGFTNYMFNPFLLSVSKYLKDFGDKLLVSTSFLLNHLYKYHDSGFSFRTLELTPEIIAINKTPELRGFIERLLQFLSKTHIREIVSGLHQFKFNSKIEHEIAFISRISEKESAAYNFTLDESLQIKKVYRRRLEEAYKRFTESGSQKYDDAVGYLNHILGDLHYHDQEYDRAIIYYKNAIRFFDEDEFGDNLVFYIRSKLKLGMTYEKKRNYDDALLIYENLTHKLTKFIKSEKQKLIKQRREEQNNEEKGIKIESNAVSALRLLYQPILAVLQLTEKHAIKSVTKSYLRKNRELFEEMISDGALKPEQSFLLKVEYFNKIGDLLYYKNGVIFGDTSIDKVGNKVKYFKNLESKGKIKYFPVSAYEYYMRSLEELLLRAVIEYFGEEKKHQFLDYSQPVKTNNLALHLVALFYHKSTEKDFPIRRKTIYTSLGNCLSDAGDCILSMHTQESKKLVIENYKKILDSKFDKSYDFSANIIRGSNDKLSTIKNLQRKANKVYEGLTQLEIAIRFIYCAALFYVRAGEIKEYAFQITKILHIFNEISFREVNKKDKENFLKEIIQDNIVSKAIRNIYRAHENTNEIEINKLTAIFGEDDFKTLIYNNTAISTDIKEILILYKEIELGILDESELTLENCFINQYSGFNSNYNRLRGLVYKSSYNYRLFSKTIKQSGVEIKNKEDIINAIDSRVISTDKDFYGHLICDSIYCLNELIKKLNIYGLSYLHNHFWLATTYKKLGFWCEILYKFKSSSIYYKTLIEKLETLIGRVEILDINPYNIYEKAIHHYHQIKEMHSEGGAYKAVLENMYYLDDNFNDNLYHFCAALERYHLNTGKVNDDIIELKTKIQQKYEPLKISNYFN